MTAQKLWTAGACLLLALAASCVKQGASETVSSPERTSVPTVAVTKAALEDLSRHVVLTAEFKPYQEVDVMAKVAGYVKRIYVDIGDRIKEGQLLAVLEVPEMEDDLAKAAAAVERSDAEISRAKDEVRRAESSHQIAHLTYTRLEAVSKTKPGLVAQQEIDDAQGKDLAAEAQVSAARSNLTAVQQTAQESRAALARVKTLYQYTRVTAPFAGVVTKRFADTGSMIQAGTASQAMPLIRLSQNSLLRLILPVPESVVPRIHVGQTVDVRVPSLNRHLPGKVARFADKVQTATRTMETEVDVPNSTFTLVPGMYAEVNLALDTLPKVLSVPLTAVKHSGQSSEVYLVDHNGTIQTSVVSTGLETPDRIEIRSGLREGDLVVIGNRSGLHPGDKVKPKITKLMAVDSN